MPKVSAEDRHYDVIARNRDRAQALQEIGELPRLTKTQQKVRDKCERSFRLFCELFLSDIFCDPWSNDHLKVIEKIEAAVLRGELYAIAMPRGFGKTSLCEAAVLWATLYGHHRYICLVGADEGHAQQMLANVLTMIRDNDAIAAHFPEAAVPIKKIEGVHQRKLRHRGRLLQMKFAKEMIIFPDIEGAPSASVRIEARGITGRIRGMSYLRPDGTKARPTLVVVDDPQTDESAKSMSQCYDREVVMKGAILGLAGHQRAIAGVVPCTVIRPDDLADRLLDRERNPDFKGDKISMLPAFPTNMKLWEEYADTRRNELKNEGDGSIADQFYVDNREAMDEGAAVAWDHAKGKCATAIQHAMNLFFFDEETFWAEYQNDPMARDSDEGKVPPEVIVTRLSKLERFRIPINCEYLVSYIDVQQELVYFTVAAFAMNFTGRVIDWGTWPDQKTQYFTLNQARHTLTRKFPSIGFEARLYKALESCWERINIDYRREDDAIIQIGRCLIDASWGDSTDIVHQFARDMGRTVMPAHGRYVGATSQPWSEYKRKEGERLGDHWRVPPVSGRRVTRHVLYDTNYWKSFVHARWATDVNDPGSLALFGRDSKVHRLFADQQCAESRTRVEAKSRVVDEWKLPAHQPDNHFFDTMVGCCVAGSMEGAKLEAFGKLKPSKRNDAQKRKRKLVL